MHKGEALPTSIACIHVLSNDFTIAESVCSAKSSFFLELASTQLSHSNLMYQVLKPREVCGCSLLSVFAICMNTGSVYYFMMILLQ